MLVISFFYFFSEEDKKRQFSLLLSLTEMESPDAETVEGWTRIIEDLRQKGLMSQPVYDRIMALPPSMRGQAIRTHFNHGATGIQRDANKFVKYMGGLKKKAHEDRGPGKYAGFLTHAQERASNEGMHFADRLDWKADPATQFWQEQMKMEAELQDANRNIVPRLQAFSDGLPWYKALQ